jgi:hypothetical protein
VPLDPVTLLSRTACAEPPMLDWLANDGQAYAAANGYVPLPSQIRALAHTMLQQITGPTGPICWANRISLNKCTNPGCATF